MTPQDIAALGAIVRESIEEHVLAATKTLSESFASQLAERDVQIKALQQKSAQPLDLSALTTVIDDLRKSIPQPYDDTALAARVAKQLEDFRSELPTAYDDAEIQKQIADLTARTNAHAEIVKGYAESLPEAYDDTKLRADLDALIKQQDEQIQLAVKMAAERPEPAAPRDGVDGRDALQLEILPSIDEQKSYPRGSYAKHAGGLWRSFEQTHGLRGWECIVDGIAWVGPTIEGKHIKMTVRTSSGHESYADAVIPAQVYKGVFDASDYEQGDTVTWAGSLWHCNKTATTAKPGDGSPDWTLAVKKGRDGREVVSVPKGAQQPVQIGGHNG